MKKNTKEKWFTAVKIFSIYAAAYGFTNHYAFYQAQSAPVTHLDAFFSFSPDWIWIYLGAVLYVPMGYFLLKTETQIKNFASSFILLSTLANLIFFFRPTFILREQHIVTLAHGRLTELAFSLLRFVDTEKNCFPSLHVASSFLITFYLLQQNKKWATVGAVYSVLVYLSTLYTKQHTVMDATSGLLLSLSCYLLVEKALPKLSQKFTELKSYTRM